MLRIGMLTSGGDCQALNAAMRGVVKGLFSKRDDVEIYGFQDGYKGLIYSNFKMLTSKDFSGILTLGGILIGMELLLPAVLGYDRVAAESYPVLPLLAGADLPGNVLARFDILWMGFLLYSLLFAIGSLLYYGNQIIGKSHPGRGRFWLPALVFLISLLEEEGKGILDYFGWCLAYIFVPGILICQSFYERMWCGCGTGEENVSYGTWRGCLRRRNLSYLWDAGSF